MPSIVIGVLAIVSIIISIVTLVVCFRISKSIGSQNSQPEIDTKPFFEELNRDFRILDERLTRQSENSDKLSQERLSNMNNVLTAMLAKSQSEQKQLQESNQAVIKTNLEAINKAIEMRLDALTRTLQTQFLEQRKENTSQIDKIRQTVDEKLDKTLNDQFEKSFKNVLNQMNALQTTMGELKTISTQVGSLEKTLNGVKTRGILGETQLRAIIENALNQNQFDIEVPTIPGSSEHVEIAIKIPNRDDSGFTYLPVDSKCHIDRYEALQQAYESNDKAVIAKEQKAFADIIKSDCKDIVSKYVAPPHTTNFGILFVPFEGMYTEIVKLDLLDTLNKEHITIAGPYTMLAILGTIVNYYQSLAIEKKTDEIENTLQATKKAFKTYDDTLTKVRKNIDSASKNLSDLQGAKTRKIIRALDSIIEYDDSDETNKLPDTSSFDGIDIDELADTYNIDSDED